ncbi:uncharacterized protein LOC142985632 [Anticarsia gemmatalis]|uniref:uncharacterized protein LOC142985632 n=1 Tax=Anticarsia gemmatalis TaxID=129554 RepID=UPI003F75AF2C
MSEITMESEALSLFRTFPPELYTTIFVNLPTKDLMKCREVCVQWKLIIDGFVNSESFWLSQCKKDFASHYWVAKRKAKFGLRFFDLYRTLSLWPQLCKAREETDEFASASSLANEIRSFEIQENGVLSIHKKCGVEYYDGETLKICQSGMILGDYSSYTENETVIVILNYHMQLYVIRKELSSKDEAQTTLFNNVKLFLLTHTELYFTKLNDEIYVCNIYEFPLKSKFIERSNDSDDGVMALSCNKGVLHILTYQRNIYSVKDYKKLVLKKNLTTERNLLDVLYRFGFLPQLDWRVYFQWMYVFHHLIPEGPLRDIVVTRAYGDIFFIGTHYGVLCIFHKPFTNGELDLFNKKPIKQINFMARCDIPVLAMCPILQIDVIETELGHTVYVAMPKKVAVLKYKHKNLHPVNWALSPDIIETTEDFGMEDLAEREVSVVQDQLEKVTINDQAGASSVIAKTPENLPHSSQIYRAEIKYDIQVKGKSVLPDSKALFPKYHPLSDTLRFPSPAQNDPTSRQLGMLRKIADTRYQTELACLIDHVKLKKDLKINKNKPGGLVSDDMKRSIKQASDVMYLGMMRDHANYMEYVQHMQHMQQMRRDAKPKKQASSKKDKNKDKNSDKDHNEPGSSKD